MRIDAHHHLWQFSPDEYGWISDDMRELRRDFLVDELREVLQTAKVDRTIAVQARQTVAETRWLIDLATTPDSPIAGVVGWLPLADPDLAAKIAEIVSAPALKGLRHVVQAELPGFLDGHDFNRGIRMLNGTGLVYDILIYARQLEEATRFVDRHPQQSFVLDHIGKPDIRGGEIVRWSERISELAARPNICCKISGMVTEADPTRWTRAQLWPYFETVLEAFGPERLMIGSDWPVLTIACSYANWWQTVESWISPLSATERSQIMGETAARIYRLNKSAPPTGVFS